MNAQNAKPTYEELLALVKRSASLLAESHEALEPRVVAHRRNLCDAIASADPKYFGIAA